MAINSALVNGIDVLQRGSRERSSDRPTQLLLVIVLNGVVLRDAFEIKEGSALPGALTKKELSARERVQAKWPEFQGFRAATYRHLLNGRRLSESDVRAVFEILLTGPLGY